MRRIEVIMLPDGRLNAKDAAAYLGLSPKTLAMKRCAGTGPKYVKRGRVFYFQADLDEWLAAGEATSTAQAAHRSSVAGRGTRLGRARSNRYMGAE